VFILDNVFRKGERRRETFGFLGLGLKNLAWLVATNNVGWLVAMVLRL
jgi:hypothetical protein